MRTELRANPFRASRNGFRARGHALDKEKDEGRAQEKGNLHSAILGAQATIRVALRRASSFGHLDAPRMHGKREVGGSQHRHVVSEAAQPPLQALRRGNTGADAIPLAFIAGALIL